MLATQRRATLAELQRLTATKARLAADDLVGLVNLDFSIARADAELGWLDLVRQRLTRRDLPPTGDQP